MLLGQYLLKNEICKMHTLSAKPTETVKFLFGNRAPPGLIYRKRLMHSEKNLCGIL